MIDITRDYTDDEIDDEIKDKIEEQEEYIKQRYHNHTQQNNNNSTSAGIIHLKIPDHENGLIKDAIYNIDTNNIRVSLNHTANADIVFTIDKTKYQNNHKFLLEDAKDYGITDIKDKNVLKALLNDKDNEKTLQADYNSNNTKSIQQEEGQQGQDQEQKIKVAELLIELFNEQDPKPILFKDEFSSPYALVTIEDHYEVLPIKNKGGKFEDYLSKLYYDNYDKVASAEAISNAKRTLRAITIFEGQIIPLYLRIAWANPDKNVIYYDMTDEKRRCIKIIKGEGWKIVENQIEKLFKRFGHELPQVEPIHVYEKKILDKFVDSLNLSNENDKILVKVWIVSLLIPEIPIPMLFPVGPEGSAKTSLQKKIRKVIDPSSYDPFSINNDKKEFIQQLSHHFFCCYDNLRYEPGWLSDEFCRAITGGSFSKRELYSDDEDIPYRYKKRMSFNGINNIFQQPDAQDRIIRTELERLDPKKKITEERIEEELKQQIPELLGYILDIVSKALEIKDSIVLEDKPRMVDFAKWGEAIARAMGYEPLRFLDAYFENIGKQKIEIIENDPFTETLTRFIDYDLRSWTSQLPIFIQNLKQYADENNIDSSKFPKKPHAISNKLRKAKATLLEGLGIEIVVDRITKGEGKIKKLKNTAIVKIRKRPTLPPLASLNQNDEGNTEDISGDHLKSGDNTSNETIRDLPERSQTHAQNSSYSIKSGDSGDGGDVFRK